MTKTKTKTYRSLVIGLGEVGTALYKVLEGIDPTFGLDLNTNNEFASIDVMHVCIPYGPDFVKTVINYREQFNPKLIIVYSSVPIGTCEEIGLEVAHSPIEGKHPDLEKSIRVFTRWIGCMDVKANEQAAEFWTRYTDVMQVYSSRFTEFLKLRSTSKYGLNIAWTEYESQIAKTIGMDYDQVIEYDHDYNYLYAQLGDSHNQRYVMYPPKGKIGGHCVIPNAEVLNSQFPSPMLDQIIRMKP